MKDVIKERADRSIERRKKLAKERYQLAKQLGFTPAEVSMLAQWSKRRIILAAKERGYQIPPELEVKQEV